ARVAGFRAFPECRQGHQRAHREAPCSHRHNPRDEELVRNAWRAAQPASPEDPRESCGSCGLRASDTNCDRFLSGLIAQWPDRRESRRRLIKEDTGCVYGSCSRRRIRSQSDLESRGWFATLSSNRGKSWTGNLRFPETSHPDQKLVLNTIGLLSIELSS